MAWNGTGMSFNPGAYNGGWNFNLPQMSGGSGSSGSMSLNFGGLNGTGVPDSDALSSILAKTGADNSGTELGFNTETLGLGMTGLGALAGLWNGFNMNKMAQKQFKLTKEMANANLTNQIKSYNTALEDKIRARYQYAGRPAEDADAYLAANKLSR